MTDTMTNGSATDHDDVAADTDTPTSRRGRGRNTALTASDDTTATLLAATMGGLLIDTSVMKLARVEIDRRYGLLTPDASVALAILLAEGLALCEAAWTDRHEHATTVAGYKRVPKAKPTRVEFPTGLIDAVTALADAQFPDVAGMVGRVASAAIKAGITESGKVPPISDPGLERVAVYARRAG